MKRLLFILFLVITFHSLEVIAEDKSTLEIHVNLNNTHKINKQIFGVHGELLWSRFRYGSHALVKEYNKLGFTTVRLPGGTTGNYYLWESGSFGCNRQGDWSEKVEKRIVAFNKALGKKNRSYSVDDFISFLKASGTGVSWLVNVVCDIPDNTRKLMEKLSAEGIELQNVELGNELNYKEHQWAFPKPMNYIKNAKLHANEIVRVFPDAKIGLVVSNASFKSKSFPDLKKASKVKKAKRGFAFDNLSSSAPFSDALIFHAYTPFGTTFHDKRRDELDYYRIYTNIVSYFDGRILPVLKYFNNLAPDKEIWITEWGLSFYGWLRPHELEFRKTFYNGLYSLNVLQTFILTGMIDKAYYHNFPNLWNTQARGIQKNPTYSSMAFISDVVNDYSDVSKVRLIGSKFFESTHPSYEGKHLEINAALYHNENKGVFFIINKYRTQYELNKLSINDDDLFVIPVRFLQISSGKGEMPSVKNVVESNGNLSNGETVNIPPFSVTKIYVDLIKDDKNK